MQRASGVSLLGYMRNNAADRASRAARTLWKYTGEVTSGQTMEVFFFFIEG